jgi:hypothetical protein
MVYALPSHAKKIWNFFSPQISLISLSRSQNKKMELKKEKIKKGKSIEKDRERKELQKSLFIKGWIFLERRKIFQLQIFLRESICSFSFYFNPSSKLFKKILALLEPSLSFAIYMT